MVLTVLLVLLAIALVGGGVGHSRMGVTGWSPAGLLVIVLAVLYFSGHLRG